MNNLMNALLRVRIYVIYLNPTNILKGKRPFVTIGKKRPLRMQSGVCKNSRHLSLSTMVFSPLIFSPFS